MSSISRQIVVIIELIMMLLQSISSLDEVTTDDFATTDLPWNVTTTVKPLSFQQVEFIQQLLKKEYINRIRPGVDAGTPVVVRVNLYISEISSINEKDMEYSLTMILRQTWMDARLKYDRPNNTADYLALNQNQFGEIWTPDTFFRNLKAGILHQVTTPNRLIRLYSDGTVLYGQRLSVILNCHMDLAKFPMDNQTCQIIFGSYGYTVDDLVLMWDNKTTPVELNTKITFNDYYTPNIQTFKCSASFKTTGDFSCIAANMYLKRKLLIYIIQVYLPSFLIVLLSWIAFWIDCSSAPARTSLGLITVLTITTQSMSLNDLSGKVTAMKAIDVWMAFCFIFIFAAFVEYPVVNVLSRKQSQEKQKASDVDQPAVENKEQSGCVERVLSGYRKLHRDNKAHLVDAVSRVIFPSLFLVFNLVYWPVYLC